MFLNLKGLRNIVLLQTSLIFTLSFFCTNIAFSQEDSVNRKPTFQKSLKISDYIQIHGFVDAQCVYNLNRDALNNTNRDFLFMLRRARFEVYGTPTSKIDFRIQADFANSPQLLDAWLRVKICKYFALQIGQIKTPFTMDNYYSPLDLEFVELSQVVVSLAGFNDVSGVKSYVNGFEIGALASGTLFDFKKNGETLPLLRYYAGVFGGSGPNMRKDNLSKDFSARIDFYPYVKNLRLSGSVYIGNYALNPNKNAQRFRYSGGVEYLGRNLTLRSEYLQGKTGVYDESVPVDSVYNINTSGLYAFVGYWFYTTWGKNSSIKQRIRPLFRYDYYVRDMQMPSVLSHYYSFGLDWWPEQHIRLHLDYTLKKNANVKKLNHSIAAKVSVKF